MLPCKVSSVIRSSPYGLHYSGCAVLAYLRSSLDATLLSGLDIDNFRLDSHCERGSHYRDGLHPSSCFSRCPFVDGSYQKVDRLALHPVPKGPLHDGNDLSTVCCRSIRCSNLWSELFFHLCELETAQWSLHQNEGRFSRRAVFQHLGDFAMRSVFLLRMLQAPRVRLWVRNAWIWTQIPSTDWSTRLASSSKLSDQPSR